MKAIIILTPLFEFALGVNVLLLITPKDTPPWFTWSVLSLVLVVVLLRFMFKVNLLYRRGDKDRESLPERP